MITKAFRDFLNPFFWLLRLDAENSDINEAQINNQLFGPVLKVLPDRTKKWLTRNNRASHFCMLYKLLTSELLHRKQQQQLPSQPHS